MAGCLYVFRKSFPILWFIGDLRKIFMAGCSVYFLYLLDWHLTIMRYYFRKCFLYLVRIRSYFEGEKQ